MALWGVALKALKRVVPLRRLVALAEAPPGRNARDLEQKRRIAGLIAYRYLARAGAAPVLLVGFARREDSLDDLPLEGHAWVTVDDQPIHDSPERLERFGVVTAFRRGV